MMLIAASWVFASRSRCRRHISVDRALDYAAVKDYRQAADAGFCPEKRGDCAMKFEDLKSIDCTVADGIARVVLNQPDRGNPIDGILARELRDLAVMLGEDDTVRAVLMSANGRMFSVGGDIKTFVKRREDLPAIVKTWTTDLHSAIARFMRMRAPVVVAVHGNVGGGSVSLVAAADIVYASRNVKFASGFAQIGFSADSGSTVTLTQRMGLSRAKRFLMLSEVLNAEEAQAAGLVDVVVGEDRLMQEAEAAAKKFAAGAPLAYAGIKQLMLRARMQGLETQMEDEAQMLAGIVRSDDAWEGVNAFVARRAPKFHGR
jgi:2-(1,2-epoxy-1,2-dihydrophenyl)acetyl-CoA isomerase